MTWGVLGVLGVEVMLKVGVWAMGCCGMRARGNESEGGGSGPWKPKIYAAAK